MDDLGVELEFADGKRIVDTPFAKLIREATNGEPERHLYKDAMKLIGPMIGDKMVRSHFRKIQSDHLRQYGG